MDEQLLQIARKFFKQLGVKISFEKLKKLLLSHPDYPSLSALSDICKELNIDCAAVKTSFEELSNNGFPTIAYMDEGQGGFFVILEDVKHGHIKYYHNNKGVVKQTIDEFNKYWSKFVFYAVADKDSGEVGYKNILNKEFISKLAFSTLIVSLIAMFGSLFYFLHPCVSINSLLLLFVKIAGLFISIQLVIHSLGSSTKFTNKVCHLGKNINCEEVLNSPASKLFGIISLSDIGFVYFISGIVSLSLSYFVDTVQSTVTLLLLIAVCSIPFMLFSLFYQAFRIKKWCPLCLSVIIILIIESIFFVVSNRMIDFNDFHLFESSFIVFVL